MSLSEIYSQYLTATSTHKERDIQRLYLSDIGKCPRQVKYRTMGTPKDPREPQSQQNASIMFDISEHIEEMLGRALANQNKLLATQLDVPIPDRENWGGRLDYILDYNGVRIGEMKTVRSNAFNYPADYPKLPHVYQAGSYDHYEREEGTFELTNVPLLTYFDRGGSNTPLEFDVDYDWEEILRLMDELDYWRAETGGLPKILPKHLAMRTRNTEVYLEPAWECGYCDYAGECKPDMSKVRMASKKGATWTRTKRGNLDILVPFVKKNAKGKIVWGNNPND